MTTWWSFPRVTVSQVIDGDTLDVTVDLGFYAFMNVRVRLYGLNAPELRKNGSGLASKNRLAGLLPAGTEIQMSVRKVTEKYGRWLAIIQVKGLAKSVNEMMVDEGLAVVATY